VKQLKARREDRPRRQSRLPSRVVVIASMFCVGCPRSEAPSLASLRPSLSGACDGGLCILLLSQRRAADAARSSLGPIAAGCDPGRPGARGGAGGRGLRTRRVRSPSSPVARGPGVASTRRAALHGRASVRRLSRRTDNPAPSTAQPRDRRSRTSFPAPRCCAGVEMLQSTPASGTGRVSASAAGLAWKALFMAGGWDWHSLTPLRQSEMHSICMRHAS
jgi:hypothetical protein